MLETERDALVIRHATPTDAPALADAIARIDEETQFLGKPGEFRARWAEGFEQAGALLWPPFAGVVLMEAVKQTFAVRPKGVRVRARAPAPVGLQPAPAGRRGLASS